MRLVVFDLDGTLVHTEISAAPESDSACAAAQSGLSRLQTEQYRRNVGEIMQAARRLGPTYIVTASNAGWMKAVTKCFAPAADTLISARDRYGGPGGQAWEWKLKAFRDLVKAHPQTTELLVIGDDVGSEIRAARALSRETGIAVRECVIRQPRTAQELLSGAHEQIKRFLARA